MTTIMLVGFDRSFKQVLQQVLIAYHYEVEAETTGKAALFRIERKRPALVLVDMDVSDIGPLDLLARLRAHDPQLPVLLLGNEIATELENTARELGVTDILRKALKLDVIMHAVNRAVQLVANASRPAGSGRATDSQLILIVDDEVEIREMVGEFLECRGYRIITAENGQDGLAKLQDHRPDLVLLDIYMPVMNGIDMLRRTTASGLQMPVIMLTASQEERLLQESLDLGAFDVLAKPVNLEQLELAVMVKLLLSEPENESGAVRATATA